MSAPRGLLGRSALLLSMLALLPEASIAERQGRHVEDLLQRLWNAAPDLASQEVRDLIEADVRSRCEASGASVLGACSQLQVLLDRWVNGGRDPVVVYDEPTGVGDWGARVLLQGPGQYIAEVRRAGGEDRTVYSQGGLPSAVAASEETIRMARRLTSDALERETEQLSRAIGHDVRPEIDALLNPPPDIGEEWRKLRDGLREAAARAKTIAVGEAENGPATPMEALSYDDFTAKYGILDDIRQPSEVPPEIKAKMEAWITDTLAKRYGGERPVSRSEWSPEDAADLAAKYRAREAAAEQGMRESHARADAAAERARHLREAFSPVPDADGNITQAELDRQLAEFEETQRQSRASTIEIVGGDPRTIERLGLRPINQLRHRPVYGPRSPALHPADRRLEAALHPAGRCTCGGERTCDWCEMDRRRELREARAERRRTRIDSTPAALECAIAGERKDRKLKARAARKARRGWA